MNLLLLDDEVAVIKILIKAVNWTELGINRVFTAYNSMEAKKIINSYEIHIIISDIEMPQENGIQFLTWVQENKPEIKNIILTGYPDFNYAQDAITIGVFNFLLKPVIFEELKTVVTLAISKIEDEKKKEIQRRYGEYYEMNQTKAEKIFYRELISEEIIPFEDYISKEIKRRGMQEGRLQLDGMILFRVQKGNFFKEKGSILPFALENIAEELFENVVMFDYGKDMIMMVKHQQEEGLSEKSRIYIDKIEKVLQLELYAYIIEDVLLKDVAQKYAILKQSSLQYFKINQKIYFAQQWINGMLKEAFPKNERENETIYIVREYLESHYNQTINRKDIEELVHLNQDYLNRVFKVATGCTLMEYIQHYRILKAKMFLADFDKAVSEIGGLVGYDSPPYFSKIFKKCTGLTPVEYKCNLEKDSRKSKI